MLGTYPISSRCLDSSASVPIIQAVTTVTKQGVIKVKNSTGDSLGYKNTLSEAQLQYESTIKNAATVTFPIQESSISALQVRITMEVALSPSCVSGGR